MNKAKHFGITIAGNIIVDTVKNINVYPGEGNLSYIKSSYKTLGGCVPNVSVVLKSMDSTLKVLALGSIGDDENGKLALSFFKENNIDHNLVQVSKDYPTSYVDAFMNNQNAKRTFFIHEGANKVFGINLPEISTKYLHVGYLLLLPYLDEIDEQGRTRMSYWLEKISKQDVIVSCDIVTEESDRYFNVIQSSLPFVNHLIINELEASKLAGIGVYEADKLNVERVIKCAKKIKSMGVKDLVVIHAPSIGIIYDGDVITKLNSLNIENADIVNSVGAGDAFCAAIIHSIILNKLPNDMLRVASCVAADVLMSQTPKPTLNAIESFLELENKYGRR